MDENNEKEKKQNRFLLLMTILLSLLGVIFVILGAVMLFYPRYEKVYSLKKYEGAVSGNVSSSVYEGNEILTHFTLELSKKEYVAPRNMFYYEKEYHYEYAFSSPSDTFFTITELTITAHYDDTSFDIAFTDTESNLLMSISEVILLSDISSEIAYSVSENSSVTAFKIL